MYTTNTNRVKNLLKCINIAICYSIQLLLLQIYQCHYIVRINLLMLLYIYTTKVIFQKRYNRQTLLTLINFSLNEKIRKKEKNFKRADTLLYYHHRLNYCKLKNSLCTTRINILITMERRSVVRPVPKIFTQISRRSSFISPQYRFEPHHPRSLACHWNFYRHPAKFRRQRRWRKIPANPLGFSSRLLRIFWRMPRICDFYRTEAE